jgi:shikimate kinase
LRIVLLVADRKIQKHRHAQLPLPAQRLCSLVGLAACTTFEDLLGSKLAKGAMKAGVSGTQPAYPGASHMGDVKNVTARHLADGQLLALELQVCCRIK